MNKEYILKLINNGFEPRIISAEFGISEVYISYIVEQQRQTAIIPNQTDDAKMKRIRDNYRAVYGKNCRKKRTLEPLREKTAKEKLIIDDFIGRLDAKYGSKSEATEQEKRLLSAKFLKEYLKYETVPLNLEELGKIHKYLFSDDLFRYYNECKEVTNNCRKANRILVSKVLEQVRHLASEAEDIEELNKINRQIPSQTQYSIDLETARRLVLERRAELGRQKNSSSLMNEVSDNMKQALEMFVSPDCDIEKIKALLDLEVQRRQTAMPVRNSFGISQDWQRKQTLIQFTKLLDTKAKEYPIHNPEKAMEFLQKIDPLTDDWSRVKTITTNLANQDREQEAIEFCTTFSKERRSDGMQAELARRISTLIKELTSLQIGKLVIRQINQDSSEEGINDGEFLRILESTMRENVIRPEQIILGMNKEGTKKIKLSDVWYDKTIKPDLGKHLR